MSKYFNPYTDFGFKKLFGEEGSKDLLIDFLNQLLPHYHQIAKLARLTPEQNEQYQKSLVQYWEVKNVTDTAFKDGKAEGLVEGKAEGLVEGKAEGLAEGEAKGKIELLKRLLTRRFGEVPAWAMATIEVANIEQLELWAEAIFDAKDIEELLK